MSANAMQLTPTDSPFFERSKLVIMTVLLSSNEAISFAELLERTQLTKGNLSSHLKKLEELKVINIEKSFRDRKPFTEVSMTDHGRIEFAAHLESLKQVLEMAKKGAR